MRYRYRQFFSLQISAYKDADEWVLNCAGKPELRIETKSMLLRDAFDFYIELYLIPRDKELKRLFDLSHYDDYKTKAGDYLRQGQVLASRHFSINNKTNQEVPNRRKNNQ